MSKTIRNEQRLLMDRVDALESHVTTMGQRATAVQVQSYTTQPPPMRPQQPPVVLPQYPYAYMYATAPPPPSQQQQYMKSV